MIVLSALPRQPKNLSQALAHADGGAPDDCVSLLELKLVAGLPSDEAQLAAIVVTYARNMYV